MQPRGRQLLRQKPYRDDAQPHGSTRKTRSLFPLAIQKRLTCGAGGTMPRPEGERRPTELSNRETRRIRWWLVDGRHLGIVVAALASTAQIAFSREILRHPVWASISGR